MNILNLRKSKAKAPQATQKQKSPLKPKTLIHLKQLKGFQKTLAMLRQTKFMLQEMPKFTTPMKTKVLKLRFQTSKVITKIRLKKF